MAYSLPGVTITEVELPQTPAISSTQRTPCFIGTASQYIAVTYEAVTRGAVGLSDSLLYTSAGIHAVSFVGSQKGLSDYVAGVHYHLTGNHIVWTSSGIVTIGATYYVSYTYNRAAADYKYKEFTTWADMYADLGANIPANTLCMIGDLAFNYFNLPKIGVVQVAIDQPTDYITALNQIMYRDIQTIGILNSSPAVRTAGIAHVVERSLPDNARQRVYYTGAPVGTALGSTGDPASICGIAYSILQERVIFMNTPRALYYYNDPTTGLSKSTVVDGAFLGAAVGCYRDAFVDPTTTLINKTMPGLFLFPDDFDGYYSDKQLTTAGAASCLVMTYSQGSPLFIDDLTTDNTSVERNNINIITAKDYIAKDMALNITRKFKGALIKNPGQFQSTVLSYVSSLMNSYAANGYIARVGSITVTLDPSRHDTVKFFYSYFAVYTAKYFEGTFSLLLA